MEKTTGVSDSADRNKRQVHVMLNPQDSHLCCVWEERKKWELQVSLELTDTSAGTESQLGQRSLCTDLFVYVFVCILCQYILMFVQK